MMEGQDYMGDEEAVFHFDDEDDEIAAMNTLAEEDLIENMEPLTPVGSADPHAPVTAAGPRRPHTHNFSSAQAWQLPDLASPPPSLSHSPSPRPTPATQYRPQHQRRPSRRPRQNQLSHQGSDQSLGQRAHRPQSTQSHHQEDLQQNQAHATPPDETLLSRQQDGQSTDAGLVTMKEGDFVEIPAEDYEQMFNGNEADRITAQKFQSEVIRAFQQNGRVVFMVGQATAQWWLSPEMQKRRRAAGRRVLDIGGAVASGAGNVIMNNTPVGGVVRSVSSNVSAFRAAPFCYTMQGLGIMKRDAAAAMVTTSTITKGTTPDDALTTPNNGRSAISEPAIVEDNPYDEFDDEDGMGMFGALVMDEDDDL